MQTWLSRIFRVNPGEAGLVMCLGSVLFANAVAQQIAGIVSVSGFLSSGSANAVLVVWIVDMSLIVAITLLQSLVIDRFDRKMLARGMIFVFALVNLILRLMFTFHASEQLIYALLFIFADVQFVVFPSVFWVLANDMTDVSQAKRVFPVIASGSFAGKLAGIGIALVTPTLFLAMNIKPEEVLALNVVIYLLAYVVIGLGLRNAGLRNAGLRPLAARQESARETLMEGWGFVKEVLAFRYLMLAILAASVVLTITEFRFLGVTKSVFATHDAYQYFYSLYRLALTVASLAMQSLFTSRIIQKIDLKNAFLIMPATLVAGVMGMIAGPGLIGTVAGMFVPKLAQKTIDDSAVSTFQGLVPEERRGRVSAFLRSYPPAVGTILGAIITGAIIIAGESSGAQTCAYIYLTIALVAAIIALLMALRARSTYDLSLLNWRMKRRQLSGRIAARLQF